MKLSRLVLLQLGFSQLSPAVVRGESKPEWCQWLHAKLHRSIEIVSRDLGGLTVLRSELRCLSLSDMLLYFRDRSKQVADS